MNCTHVFVTWTITLNIRHLHRQIYTNFLHNIIPILQKLPSSCIKAFDINLFFFLQKEIKGGLKTQKVEFTYPARSGVTVLQSFSISVVPGHTLALAGSSGSGKSSVISLIERFYDPTACSILFDGKDIRELNIFWYLIRLV